MHVLKLRTGSLDGSSDQMSPGDLMDDIENHPTTNDASLKTDDGLLLF